MFILEPHFHYLLDGQFLSMFLYLYHRRVHLHIYFWFYIMFVLSLMLVLTLNFYYFSAAVLITRMVWRWVLSTCLFSYVNCSISSSSYWKFWLLSLIPDTHLQILCIIWLYELGCKAHACESISLTVHTLIEPADTVIQTQILTKTHIDTHTQRTVMQLVLSSLHTQIEMKLFLHFRIWWWGTWACQNMLELAWLNIHSTSQ